MTQDQQIDALYTSLNLDPDFDHAIRTDFNYGTLGKTGTVSTGDLTLNVK